MAETAAAMEEADTISVDTTPVGNRLIANAGEEREFVLKFLFRPKGGNNNTAVARTHYAILRAINDIYPEVQIFDNFGQAMREFPAIKSYDAYLRHFKLQFVKANENKNRKAIYLVFHRILSTIPIGEIRRHATISALLQKVKAQMTVHHWNEDDTRIANLGFFVGIDPVNVPHEELEERVCANIEMATKRPRNKIPRFLCTYNSPFFIDSTSGARTSTKAYDLQCRQRDAKDMVALLQKTFATSPVFMFHKVRHQKPEVYRASIRKQNSYLANTRVVPVQGIPSKLMFYLRNELLQIPGVQDVAGHRQSATTGRHNVITTAAKFKEVTGVLSDCLAPLVISVANAYNFDLSDMQYEPTLAFRSQPYDEASSEGTFQSYLSACSSIYTTTDEDLTVADTTYAQPPRGSAPTPQAWGGNHVPPSVIEAIPIAKTVDSPISQADFDRVTQENARLTRMIGELSQQVQQLLDAQRQQQSSAPSSLASPHPSSFDLQAIITATTTSVLAALRSNTFDVNSMGAAGPQNPAQSITQPFESSTRQPGAADTSFDSSNMDHESA